MEYTFHNVMYLNVFLNQFERADISMANGIFTKIAPPTGEPSPLTLVPGFVDGHVHLESAVVTPDEYARAVVPHGTSCVVTDPHEISNVMGCEGFDYILQGTENLPMDVFLMIPSCVPATPLDESGAVLDSAVVERYLSNPRVLGLAEMMNFKGVLDKDSEVLKKIEATKRAGKLVDGHAPGLSGEDLDGYIAAGISSDHECSFKEEAIEKLKRGQWIMIREGTACKNLTNLVTLLQYPYGDRCLLVTDDKHPGSLVEEGHIDHIIRKAISLGAVPEYAYKAGSFNAYQYFKQSNRGAIAPGYHADFVVLEDVKEVAIRSVYKAGVKVSDHGRLTVSVDKPDFDTAHLKNTVHIGKLSLEDFDTQKEEKVIGLVEGEILTTDQGMASHIDVEQDILKLAVVERHKATGHVGVSYVKGYGLKSGAIATSIAHDSHNIIVVGTTEEDILFAVKAIEEMQGGMVVVREGAILEKLPLPIAGLMSEENVETTQEIMDRLKQLTYEMGVNRGIDPFMTLSFISLPVIPKLRLTTRGVVEVKTDRV